MVRAFIDIIPRALRRQLSGCPPASIHHEILRRQHAPPAGCCARIRWRVSLIHFFQAILSEQSAHFVSGFPDAVRADEQDLTVLDGGGRLAVRVSASTPKGQAFALQTDKRFCCGIIQQGRADRPAPTRFFFAPGRYGPENRVMKRPERSTSSVIFG